MIIKVNITQKNIDEARLVDVRHFPIGEALGDLGYDRIYDRIYVQEDYIEIRDNGILYRCSNNINVKSFIQDFDNEEKVVPCTLNLEFIEI